jgi:tetratricopeptide (TPR) repeat protein
MISSKLIQFMIQKHAAIILIPLLYTLHAAIACCQEILTTSAVVEVSADPPKVLAELKDWKNVPGLLKQARIYDKASLSNMAVKFSVKEPGLVLLAASWNYQGGGWEDTIAKDRQLLGDLMRDGWVAIGTMMFRDDDQHVIFRRAVKAGETFKLHTRNQIAPFVIKVPDTDVAAVMAAPTLVSPDRRTLLTHGPGNPGDKTGTTDPNVVLFKARDAEQHRPAWVPGMLLREIVRQGLSMAARDELGLATRDSILRERLPQETGATNLPLEMYVAVQSTYDVETAIFRRNDNNWDCLWDDTLTFQRDHFYERLVTSVEALSRTELTSALKKAGFQAHDLPASRDSSIVPDEVEQLLARLTIPAQLAALRALHAEIQNGGDSPELLGALARGYATLGVLTERLWSPAHKGFKARALLYAERAVAHWPKSALVLRNRAFARALVGLHSSALEDLAQANDMEPHGPNQSAETSAPAWAPIIEAYCNFDADALAAAGQKESQRPLVRLLELLSAEASGNDREVMQAVGQLLEAVPGCLRAVDGADQVEQLGAKRYAAQLGPAIAGQQLLNDVGRVPNLPAQVKKLIDDQKATSRDEISTRLEVIGQLRDAGAESSDKVEPSWRVVAQLLEDVDFVLAWRQIDEAAYWLGISADEREARVNAVWPQVEHHPYGQFIASYRADKDQSSPSLRALIKSLDLSRVEYIEQPMLDRIGNFDGAWRERNFAIGYWHEDLIASDLPRDIRRSSDPMTQIPYLRVVSPHMPFGIAQEIVHGAGTVRTDAAALEKRYAHSAQVQAALAKYFVDQKRPGDAIRCFEAALKLDPNKATYEGLAAVYEQQGDEQKWLSTLEDYLKTADFGLGHARVQETIANHFIEKRQWDKARPYADAAGATWAEWGMLKAAQCAEAMQDWDAAEGWYKNVAHRYDNTSTAFVWYTFCKRTGKGNVAAAEQFALDALQRHEKTGNTQSFDCGVAYTLAGRYPEAAQAFDAAFQEHLVLAKGLYAAVAFERAQDPKSRDRVLATIAANAKEYPQDHPVTQGCLKLAAFMSAAAAKPDSDIDFGELEKLAAAMSRADRPYFLCLLGQYADLRGQNDRATQFYQQCMGFIRFTEGGRTLAGAELVARGIMPESYKAAIWEKPDR